MYTLTSTLRFREGTKHQERAEKRFRNALLHALSLACTEAEVTCLPRIRIEYNPFTPSSHLQKYTVSLLLHRIRLKKAKPYCGNHAGPCPADTPRDQLRKLTVLEALDWIRFNTALNKAIDANPDLPRVDISSTADVTKGRVLWIRKNGVGRRRWIYTGPGLDRKWLVGDELFHWEGSYREHDESLEGLDLEEE